MALIRTPEQRRAERSSKSFSIFVMGPAGIGKSKLAETIDGINTANGKKVLYLSLEKGDTSVSDDWDGDIINVNELAAEMNSHPWEMCRYMCGAMGGIDPCAEAGSPYHRDTVAQFRALVVGVIDIDSYDTAYIDSVTEASRLCLDWCRQQPECFNKEGVLDMRGAYGLLAKELIGWGRRWHHSQINKVLVAIISEELDDYKRKVWVPQIDGSKSSAEYPGIFDDVFFMNVFDDVEELDGCGKRRFVTNVVNPWKVYGKDRTETLELREPADLGAVIRKIRSGKKIDKVKASAQV